MLKKLIAFIRSDEIENLKADLAHSSSTNAYIRQFNVTLQADRKRLSDRLGRVREQRDEAVRRAQESRFAAARATPDVVAALRTAIAHERKRNKELEESLSAANAVLKETQDELAFRKKEVEFQRVDIQRLVAHLGTAREDRNALRKGQTHADFSIIAVENPVYHSKSGLIKVKLRGTHWAVYHTRTMERISMFRKSHAEAAAVSYNAIKEYNERNRA